MQGENVRADGRSDTERYSSSVGVHILGDLLLVAHDEGGHSAGGVDDLESTQNVSLGVGESLSLFEDDGAGDIVVVFPDEGLESVGMITRALVSDST